MDTLEEKIESGRQKIQRLLEMQTIPRRLPTKARVIAGLREDIAQMRTKEWSWDGIAKVLKDEGIVDATAETIRLVYDGKAKKKYMKTTNKKPKREKAAIVVAPDKIQNENQPRTQERIVREPIPRQTESASKTVFPSDSDL
jgi:hypothetical protein